jgi:hypothetical protein
VSYRNELDALAARHAALDAQVRELARERDQAASLLEEVRARAKLPVLDHIRVAAPCSESWDAMTGDDRARTCARCQHQVFDLSQMTRDEAEALIHSRTGRLCVRYFRRADGTILTADCPVGVRKRRRRRRVAVAIGATLAATGAVAMLRPAHGPPAPIMVDAADAAVAAAEAADVGSHMMGQIVERDDTMAERRRAEAELRAKEAELRAVQGEIAKIRQELPKE